MLHRIKLRCSIRFACAGSIYNGGAAQGTPGRFPSMWWCSNGLRCSPSIVTGS